MVVTVSYFNVHFSSLRLAFEKSDSLRGFESPLLQEGQGEASPFPRFVSPSGRERCRSRDVCRLLNSPSVHSERSLQRVASMASRAERGECSALHDGVVGALKGRGRYKRSA